MSHTFEGSEGTIFISDSDVYGSKVKIRTFITDNRFKEQIVVNGSDIIEFVADWVMREKISKLEDDSAFDILGLDFDNYLIGKGTE